MSLKSKLLRYLSQMPNTETVPQREALITLIGFDYLNPHITWEGSKLVFLNKLIQLLFSQGKIPLKDFLRELANPRWQLFGLEDRQRLTELADEVEGLTVDEWEQLVLDVSNNRKVTDTNLRHNLPQPDYGKFIGREQEFQEILKLLRPYPDSKHFVITIDGVGGIGKTALALEVSLYFFKEHNTLSKEEHFQTIIWTSARRTTLEASRGIVELNKSSFTTLDDICDTIAITLGVEKSVLTQGENKQEFIIRELSKQRALLIIDNFETIDDKSVIEFIQQQIPATTKVIVTTRHRLDTAYPIRLKGMSESDGESLIEEKCKNKKVKLTGDEKTLLFKRTGGVPLAIVWSIGLVALGDNIDTVLRRLGSNQSDLARFCFEKLIEKIKHKDSYKMLLLIAVFSENKINRSRLGELAGFGEDVISRDDAIIELTKSSLINEEQEYFTILPLTKVYVEQKVMENQHDEQKFITQVSILSNSQILSQILIDIEKTNANIGTQSNYQKEQNLSVSSSAKTNALGLWKRKLEYFLLQEAIVSDPAQKFQLKEQIKECRQKIRELQAETSENLKQNKISKLELLEILERMTPTQFNRLIFTLEIPHHFLPSPDTTQTDRAIALLSWADSPTGCGLAQVEQALEELTNY